MKVEYKEIFLGALNQAYFFYIFVNSLSIFPPECIDNRGVIARAEKTCCLARGKIPHDLSVSHHLLSTVQYCVQYRRDSVAELNIRCALLLVFLAFRSLTTRVDRNPSEVVRKRLSPGPVLHQ